MVWYLKKIINRCCCI